MCEHNLTEDALMDLSSEIEITTCEIEITV